MENQMNECEDWVARTERAIQAAQMEPAAHATEILKQAIRALLDGADLNDNRVCCAMGRCWYHHPIGIAYQPGAAERWLRRALDLEPGDHLARLYLARIRFNGHRYREARALFLRIPDDYFAAYQKAWLDLKKEEWVLCCDVFLNGGRVDVAALRAICQRFEALPEEEAPVPLDLVRAVTWAVTHSRTAFPPRESARECTALIRRMGLAELFQPELERLRGEALLGPNPPATVHAVERDSFINYELDTQAHALENIA